MAQELLSPSQNIEGQHFVLLSALKEEYLMHDVIAQKIHTTNKLCKEMKSLIVDMKKLLQDSNTDVDIDEIQVSDSEDTYWEQKKKNLRQSCKSWIRGEIKSDGVNLEPLSVAERSLLQFTVSRGEKPPAFAQKLLSQQEWQGLQQMSQRKAGGSTGTSSFSILLTSAVASTFSLPKPKRKYTHKAKPPKQLQPCLLTPPPPVVAPVDQRRNVVDEDDEEDLDNIEEEDDEDMEIMEEEEEEEVESEEETQLRCHQVVMTKTNPLRPQMMRTSGPQRQKFHVDVDDDDSLDEDEEYESEDDTFEV